MSRAAATTRSAANAAARSPRKPRQSNTPAPQGDAPDDAPTDAAGDARFFWDDVPLRTKLTLLVLLGAVGGVLVGVAEAQLGYAIWPIGVGLTVVTVAVVLLGHRWACRPIERLLRQIDRAANDDQPKVMKTLPTSRRDEVGQLARALHRVSTVAFREHKQARHLRRTIDHRVDRATRQATRRLEELAMRDALTELGNRRFLDENLDALVKSCLESNTDLVCVLIDLDNFKQVNDNLGHAAGDELLLFLGSLIRASIRHEDYAARIGGDEFVILMPGCPIERVQQFGRQLIALFRQHARTYVRDGNTTMPDLSIGAASLKHDGLSNGPDLLEKADQCLYHAKESGKGRVVGCEPKARMT